MPLFACYQDGCSGIRDTFDNIKSALHLRRIAHNIVERELVVQLFAKINVFVNDLLL